MGSWFSMIYRDEEAVKNAKLRDNEAVALEKELTRQGHICVRLDDSYPRQVFWCKSNPCSHDF